MISPRWDIIPISIEIQKVPLNDFIRQRDFLPFFSLWYQRVILKIIFLRNFLSLLRNFSQEHSLAKVTLSRSSSPWKQEPHGDR